MVRPLIYSAIVGCAGVAMPAMAQDEVYTAVCEAKGANGMVAMLLCPEGLTIAEYAKEGKFLCQDTKPCGAWIWTDAAHIPEEVPDAHDKLPKESVQNAIAIWMNELDQLITIQGGVTN